MNAPFIPAERQSERGQTLVLVAVCIVSLLAMAALAVDVVTLYVAKGEVQRAADACALAGAKGFVESGVTSDVTVGSLPDPQYANLQTIAQSIATGYIAEALKQNLVSGSPGTLVAAPTFDFTTYPGNPRITLTVQRRNLPIFFARIWSRNLASVSATASAEAYNPSNSQSNTGNLIAVSPHCVKPLLVRNGKRGGGPTPVPKPFIKITDGTINPTNPAGTTDSAFLGFEFTLHSGTCPGATASCVAYFPAVAPTTHNFCSSCAAGINDYEQSIECCDGSSYDLTQCGDASATQALADTSGFNPGGAGGPTQTAMQCLIHASGSGPGNGQDTVDVTNYAVGTGPIQILAGTYSQTKLSVAANAPISTSDSIITLPIFDDPGPPPPSGKVTIVGFLQVFVNFTDPNGDLDVTILNIAGCGPTASAVPQVSGGGISAIPVRLVN